MPSFLVVEVNNMAITLYCNSSHLHRIHMTKNTERKKEKKIKRGGEQI